MKIDFNKIKTKRQLHNIGVYALIQMFGDSQPLLDKFQKNMKEGILTHMQAFRLREAIHDAEKEYRRMNHETKNN